MPIVQPSDFVPIYGQDTIAPELPVAPSNPTKFRVYHDYPIPLWTGWDVPTAMDAVEGHGLGQFNRSALMADAMGTDDSLDAVLHTRVLGLLSRDACMLRSIGGNPAKAKLALSDLRVLQEQILPEETLAQLQRWALLMGFALAQVLWHYQDKKWVPELQVWHPSLVYYRLDTRCYYVSSMEGQVPVIPGTGQWLLYTPYGSYRGWMQGAVRSVFIPWLCRQYALRDWARYSEVHGLPIKKAKVPAEASGADKDAFSAAISNLANETAVMLPQGVGGKAEISYDIDLLEATGNSWEAFEKLITKCETRMAIRLLGQNLTTEIAAGSFAAANVHDRVRLDYTRADARTLGSCLTSQLIAPFCAFNYGSVDIAPRLTWNVQPPEDKVAKAQAVGNISVAIMNFATAGARVDHEQLLTDYGIPTLSPAEAPLVPPALAPGADITPNIKSPNGEPRGEGVMQALDTPVARLAPKGAIAGQTYADDLTTAATLRATEAISETRRAVIDAVKNATSYDDMKERLKASLKDAKASKLEDLMTRAIMMAKLAGKHSLREDKS